VHACLDPQAEAEEYEEDDEIITMRWGTSDVGASTQLQPRGYGAIQTAADEYVRFVGRDVTPLLKWARSAAGGPSFVGRGVTPLLGLPPVALRS
jgi:hypothetical protein